MNIICIAKWLIWANFEKIKLKIYNVPVCLQGVNTFVNQKWLSYKHVLIFLPLKYDVISQLCHIYANDSFLRDAYQIVHRSSNGELHFFTQFVSPINWNYNSLRCYAHFHWLWRRKFAAIFTSVEYFLYKLYWKQWVCHDSMKSIAMQISTAPPISFCGAYEVVDING